MAITYNEQTKKYDVDTPNGVQFFRPLQRYDNRDVAEGSMAMLPEPKVAELKTDPNYAARDIPTASPLSAESGKPLTDEEKVAMQENERKRIQEQIFAIENAAKFELANVKRAGEFRAGQSGAISVASGAAGSDYATAAAEKTKQFNSEQEQAVEAEKQAKIMALYDKSNERADAKILAERTLRTQNAEAFTAQMDKLKTAARTDFETVAKTGKDWDSLPGDQRTKFRDQTGYGDQAGDVYRQIQKEQRDADAMNKKTITGEDGAVYQQQPDGSYKQIIAAPPPKETHSPIYTEWQDAVKSGYKGTLTQYQNEDANRKNSTVKAADAERSVLQEAVSDLKSTVGGDGFVNTPAYKAYREKFLFAHPGKEKLFDTQMKQFGLLLNPNDASGKDLKALVDASFKDATGNLFGG